MAGSSSSASTTPTVSAPRPSTRRTSWALSAGWAWNGTRGSRLEDPTGPTASRTATTGTRRSPHNWSPVGPPITTTGPPSSSRNYGSAPKERESTPATTSGDPIRRPTAGRSGSRFPRMRRSLSTIWFEGQSASSHVISTTLSSCAATAVPPTTSRQPSTTSTTRSPMLLEVRISSRRRQSTSSSPGHSVPPSPPTPISPCCSAPTGRSSPSDSRRSRSRFIETRAIWPMQSSTTCLCSVGPSDRRPPSSPGGRRLRPSTCTTFPATRRLSTPTSSTG